MYIQFPPSPVPPPPPPGLPIDEGLWILVLIAVVYVVKIMNAKKIKNVSRKK